MFETVDYETTTSFDLVVLTVCIAPPAIPNQFYEYFGPKGSLFIDDFISASSAFDSSDFVYKMSISSIHG